jgi:prevent-host-death family protein
MTKCIAAGEFKAKCLALLDEVATTGMPLIITKRGKPVAKLVSAGEVEPPNLLGSVRYEREEDLLEPVDEPWEAEQ